MPKGRKEGSMKTVSAMVQSLKGFAKVEIIKETSPNNVEALYNGKRCTAIHNVFNGLYYVDDVYGVLSTESGEKNN